SRSTARRKACTAVSYRPARSSESPDANSRSAARPRPVIAAAPTSNRAATRDAATTQIRGAGGFRSGSPRSAPAAAAGLPRGGVEVERVALNAAQVHADSFGAATHERVGPKHAADIMNGLIQRPPAVFLGGVGPEEGEQDVAPDKISGRGDHEVRQQRRPFG